MSDTILQIDNLSAQVDGHQILQGLNLTIKTGECHVIMGPNGSGKSTLGHVLAGKDCYNVSDGKILMDNQDLLAMDIDARARAGLFLAFQYPVEIPGVGISMFLRHALNAKRAEQGLPDIDPIAFVKKLRALADKLNIAQDKLKRAVNFGFSGGEKKRLEIMQMALLEPKIAILDEADSGLDIDALREIATAINAMRDGTRSFLLITHYQRFLDYIVPDYVHILAGGKIIKSGGPELALQLEEKGYADICAA